MRVDQGKPARRLVEEAGGSVIAAAAGVSPSLVALGVADAECATATSSEGGVAPVVKGRNRRRSRGKPAERLLEEGGGSAAHGTEAMCGNAAPTGVPPRHGAPQEAQGVPSAASVVGGGGGTSGDECGRALLAELWLSWPVGKTKLDIVTAARLRVGILEQLQNGCTDNGEIVDRLGLPGGTQRKVSLQKIRTVRFRICDVGQTLSGEKEGLAALLLGQHQEHAAAWQEMEKDLRAAAVSVGIEVPSDVEDDGEDETEEQVVLEVRPQERAPRPAAAMEEAVVYELRRLHIFGALHCLGETEASNLMMPRVRTIQLIYKGPSTEWSRSPCGPLAGPRPHGRHRRCSCLGHLRVVHVCGGERCAGQRPHGRRRCLGHLRAVRGWLVSILYLYTSNTSL